MVVDAGNLWLKLSSFEEICDFATVEWIAKIKLHFDNLELSNVLALDAPKRC